MAVPLLKIEEGLGVRRPKRRHRRDVKAHDEGKPIGLRYDSAYWCPHHTQPAEPARAPLPPAPVPASASAPPVVAAAQSVVPSAAAAAAAPAAAPAPPQSAWTEDDDAHAAAAAFVDEVRAFGGAIPADDLRPDRAHDDYDFLDRVRASERERSSALSVEQDAEEMAVEPEQTSAPPRSQYDRHEVFDRMAAHATTFDAGAFSVDVASAFDAFDADIESRAATEAVQQALRSELVPKPELGRMDVMEDLRRISEQAAAVAPRVVGRRADEFDEGDAEEAEEQPADDEEQTHAAALGVQSFDVRHEVQLVPQQTGMSCWAAAAAMIVSWRDRISVDPSEIARAGGYWSQYRDGLAAEDTKMFGIWGLVPEEARSYTVEMFRELIETHGPLWVASAEPGPHVRVVSGIHGDGSPDSTMVEIADPWERGMTTFRQPNTGARYTETYRQFVEKQERLARSEQKVQGIYVAHAAGRPSDR
jgi:hypothetical protein